MNSQIQPGPGPAAGGPRAPGRPAAALSHPLRAALLGLLAARATLTATEAARELGESSGACSFHLRQLARYGQVEEVPGSRGRSRPWRLPVPAAPVAGGPVAGGPVGGPAGAGPVLAAPAGDSPAGDSPGQPAPAGGAAADEEFGALARELENEGYRRWLAGRGSAPEGWHDEAFSTIVYLTPAELAEAAAAVRAVLAEFGQRHGPGTGQALPVGVVARLFPLLPAGPDA